MIWNVERRLLGLAAAGALSVAGACTPAPREAPRRAPVAAAATPAPRASQATDEERLLGVVVAPQTVDLTSQVEGRLLAIAVRVGDRVDEGALLARLDGRSAKQELRMARAALATAVAERERARLELLQANERAERRAAVVELPNETVSTVSAEELSTSRYQARSAQAKLAAAQAAVLERSARLEQMRLLVSEGALRAPFDAVVVARYLDAGSAVHKATPVVRLLEAGDLKVRFAVPEEKADAVAVGLPVRIAAGDEIIGGTVEKVAPEVEAASRMVFAEASIAPGDQHKKLRSGQEVRVSLMPPVASAAP